MSKLYVLKCNELYKIGVTSQPMKKRLSDLQTGNPEPLEVVFTRKCSNYLDMEVYFHKLFADKRIRGEWFRLTNEDLGTIVTCRKYSVLRK
jgi:hypothetical protein